MVFGISPEACSASPRNAVRVAPEYAPGVGESAALWQTGRQSRRPLAEVVVCAESLTVVAFVVKTGENAVILNRR
jgi:hypothetical protein